MSEFRNVFEHLLQFKIIICELCQYAVVPSQIERHIKDHHPQLTAGVRRKISQAAIELPDFAHRQEDVIYPDAGSEPVPGFPIVTNALRCSGGNEALRLHLHSRENHATALQRRARLEERPEKRGQHANQVKAYVESNLGRRSTLPTSFRVQAVEESLPRERW